MKKGKKKYKGWMRALLWIMNILITLVVAFVILIAVLFATEFYPEEKETLEADGTAEKTVRTEEPITLMTFNIGYGSLGENADFFLDGGESVKTADKEKTLENMSIRPPRPSAATAVRP